MATKSRILLAFITWRLLLLVLLVAAPSFFAFRPNFLATEVSEFVANPLLWSHANYDGDHYLNIAQGQYGFGEQAFFPFYPLLIEKLSSIILIPTVWTALLISNLSFLASLFILYKLIRLDFPQNIAKSTLFWLLIFPVSFYFGAVYTESLFLLLIVLSFYLARRKHWWLGSFVGGLATATRFVGIFLLPALIIEKILQDKQYPKQVPQSLISWASILLVPTGLIFYMIFLQDTTGDPLRFIHLQSTYGQFRSERIIMLYQVFWRYVKMILTVNRADPLYITILLEAFIGVVFLITSIVSFKVHRLSLAVFNSLAYLIPTMTGSFTSLPRYVLVCFPSFVLLAMYFKKHPFIRIAYLTLSSAGLFYFWMKFTQGYWVG